MIIDDDNRIGAPSTVSKTIVPELVTFNSENGTVAFYDCPGFDDTRGSEVDIAANYYMSQILKNKVKRAKLIFLVTHSSVKLGNDRLDFDLLAEHVAQFVSNLRKYRDSFGLVVTKVNSFSEWGRPVSDRMLTRGITEFLAVYNETLHAKLAQLTGENSTELERGVLENKIFFVTTLLQQDNQGNFPKISFSRNPEKCGPLSNSTIVARTRQLVGSMYRDNLQYTPVSKDDFGFTLKDKTILDIQNYSIAVNTNVAKGLGSIFTVFQEWYESSHFPTNISASSALKMLQADTSTIGNLIENINMALNNLTTFVELVIGYLETTKFPIPTQFTSFMMQQKAYLEFFTEAVSRHQHGQTQLGSFQSWLQPISNLRDKYFLNLRDWYEFISNLENPFGAYAFQASKTRANCNFKSGPELLRYLKNETIIPVGNHIIQIGSEIGRQHFTFLETMVKFATTPAEVSCTGRKLTIKGNFVRLGEFFSQSGRLIQGDRTCNVEVVNWVEIYASNKLFIDNDINGQGKELNVIILAPIWVILQNRRFNLDGFPGADASPPTAASGSRLAYSDGGHGQDGSEGHPGGPGGNLFGAATKIEGTGVLQVTLNGGKGGKGQHGGVGGEGAPGRDADKGDARWNWSLGFLTLTYTGTHNGYEGYSGGNGGSGGFGGAGGYPGSLTISVEGGGLQKVSSISNHGENGQDGQAGGGGFGGRDGRGIECENKKALFFITTRNQCSQRGQNHHRASKGQDGLTGGWRRMGYRQARVYIPPSSAPQGTNLLDNSSKVQALRNYLDMFRTIGKSETTAFVRFIQARLLQTLN